MGDDVVGCTVIIIIIMTCERTFLHFDFLMTSDGLAQSSYITGLLYGHSDIYLFI